MNRLGTLIKLGIRLIAAFGKLPPGSEATTEPHLRVERRGALGPWMARIRAPHSFPVAERFTLPCQPAEKNLRPNSLTRVDVGSPTSGLDRKTASRARVNS